MKKKRILMGFGGLPDLVEQFKKLPKKSQKEVMKKMGGIKNENP